MDLLGRVFTIVLLFTLYQGKTKAQFTLDSKPPDVVYVEAGKTLRLDVTFTYTGVLTLTLTWSFNGKTLVQKIGNAKPVSLLPGRADIEGQGSLVLKNTSLLDNGTYRFQWGGSASGNTDFTVIILVQPTAILNVSSPTTVQEHGDVYYGCEGKNGVPTSNVSWYRENKLVVKGKFLSFRNIKREQAGSYICKVQSGTLTDETELKIIVEFLPNITSFKSVPDIAIIKQSVKITCKAEGVPDPTYAIYHNGTKVTDTGEITIQSIKRSDAGEYRCNATNKLGKHSRSYFLKVNEKATTTTQATSTTMTPTMSTPRTTSNTSDEKKSRTKDGTAVIVVIIVVSCGCVIIIYFLISCFYCDRDRRCSIICCCRRDDGNCLISGCCFKKNSQCSIVCLCCKRNRKSTDRDEQEVQHAGGSNASGSLPRANDDNAYETVDQEKIRQAAENEDRAGPSNEDNDGAEPDSSLPPVYAVVDKKKKKKEKEKRPPQPTYASLDPVALQPDSSKMRDRSRQETNYASINLDSLQSDLV